MALNPVIVHCVKLFHPAGEYIFLNGFYSRYTGVGKTLLTTDFFMGLNISGTRVKRAPSKPKLGLPVIFVSAALEVCIAVTIIHGFTSIFLVEI